MYAEERQRSIVSLALRHDRVSVTELAAQFEVTPETIRRDLDVLDQRGILRRVHGGAVPAENVRLVETALPEREVAHTAEKKRIGIAAVAQLPIGTGATVLIDSGTTTAQLANAIPQEGQYTVVTNSVSIASQLAIRQRGEVQLLGGRVRGLTQATVGGDTVDAIRRIRVDVAFLGTNGLTLSHGLSTPDPDEAAVKRAMASAARKVVVLADSTKIGAELMLSFARIDEIDVLVTDKRISPTDHALFTNHGIEVVVA